MRNARRGSMATCTACIALTAVLGSACAEPQDTAAQPSPVMTASPTVQTSPFFDSSPAVLTSGFTPGVGEMACSPSELVFTSGPLHTLYVTSATTFNPKQLLSANDKIGRITFAGDWAALVTYAQAGNGQISPLASWSVYGVQISTGRAVTVATGANPTELSELPGPVVIDDSIYWDELMSPDRKVLWRYDLNSGAKTMVGLPAEIYPVALSASAGRILFLDNNRDPAHSRQTWVYRGGEPLLLDIRIGQLSHPASGLVVGSPALTDSRAAWLTGSASGSAFEIQELKIADGKIKTLAEVPSLTPILVDDQITIWETNPRSAVTARLGSRTAVVSPDLVIGGEGMALCGSDLFYAGPNLSLRVAHIA